MNKKFISIIWGYHKQIFSFDKKQNYHMLPLEAMKEEWFECEIFAISSQVKIEDDPNFINWVKVIYYKNIFQYLFYLWKNRSEIIYSNSLTIKTLLVWMFWKKTVFMAHDQTLPLLKEKIIKRIIVLFFYRFFSFIRVINLWESSLLNTFKIKNYILPLSVSDDFFSNNSKRDNLVFIWNLYFDKNPEFLIETMKIVIKKFPDINLNIFWEDRYNNNWKNFRDIIIENWLDKNILINWFVSHNILKQELHKALVYINTSISEWQCLAVYEAWLAWCFLCLQNILSFPSVFNSNSFYHNTSYELAQNIIEILNNTQKYNILIENNQRMIIEKYNYDYIKWETKKMFLELNKQKWK